MKKTNQRIIKVCCLTGHRPKGFLWDYYNTQSDEHQRYLSALRICIMNLIEKQGVNYFISGCAIGADLDFAEICVSIRDSEHSDILIEGAIPCDNQDLKWSKPDKERYKTIISKLNRVHYVSHMYSKICFQKRNEYMVDRSDIVIAVWNKEETGGTWNTIKYARQKQKSIDYILLENYIR